MKRNKENFFGPSLFIQSTIINISWFVPSSESTRHVFKFIQSIGRSSSSSVFISVSHSSCRCRFDSVICYSDSQHIVCLFSAGFFTRMSVCSEVFFFFFWSSNCWTKQQNLSGKTCHLLNMKIFLFVFLCVSLTFHFIATKQLVETFITFVNCIKKNLHQKSFHLCSFLSPIFSYELWVFVSLSFPLPLNSLHLNVAHDKCQRKMWFILSTIFSFSCVTHAL